MRQFAIINSDVTIVRVFANKINKVSPVHYPASLRGHPQLSLRTEQLALQMKMELLQMLKKPRKKSQYQMSLMVCQRNLNCVHYMGAFHSLKYLRPYKTRANGTEISLESFQKIYENGSVFKIQTIPQKIPEMSNEMKMLSKKSSKKKNCIYPSRLSRLFFYKLWKMLFQLSLKIFRN